MIAMNEELFNIWTYDQSGKKKNTNHITVPAPVDKDGDATLATIRELLIKGKLDSKKARLPFCTKDGARIGDGSKWALYKELVVGGLRADNATAKEKDTKTKETTDQDEAPVSDTTRHDVYLELPEEETERKDVELREPVKKFLEKSLDMSFSKEQVNLLAASIKDFNLGSYDHSQFRSNVTAETLSAGTLSDTDWDIVCRATHFLNGHRLVFMPTGNGTTRRFQRIDKAPNAAFSIKARDLSELGTAALDIVIPKEAAKHKYPQYIVTDGSYVNVFETAGALSTSLADSNFSQTDVEASIGGNLFSFSAGVKGGFSRSESDALASSQQSKNRTMNITYNFPRVVLHLNNSSLELTTNCSMALEQFKNAGASKEEKRQKQTALIQFHQNFGHFFATNVELGGKLLAKEQFTSSDRADTAEKANALKVSAALSFSSPWVQGSASYSKDKQHAENSAHQTSRMSKALSWEAVGGDTTLCNNPSAWSPTVKSFRNWRVINQKDVMAIGDFIGTFDKFDHIPGVFRAIIKDSSRTVTCRFRLRADEGADKLIEGGNQFYGLRKNDFKQKNFALFEALREDILKDRIAINDFGVSHITDAISKAEKKLEGVGYTVHWHEYFGIDSEKSRTLAGGCDFETDALTELEQEPLLQYGEPYKIFNKAFRSYLAADTTTQVAGRKLGLLYYTRMPDFIARFVFLNVEDPHITGSIKHEDHVELHLCDKENNPIGQVKRFSGDQATLAVELYGSIMPNLLLANDSYMEYIRAGEKDK